MRSHRTTTVIAIAMALTVAPALAACSTATPETPAASSAADAAAPADVMFAQMMIPHHAQAVEMSTIMLDKEGMPTEVRELAQQIADEQEPEIAEMRGWLDDWGMPEMGDMSDMGGHAGHGGMDGMLSDEQLDELRAATGDDAVRLFLEQMIAHHEGAIEMGRDVLHDGRHPDVRAFAERMIDAQQAEIDTMREWLAR